MRKIKDQEFLVVFRVLLHEVKKMLKEKKYLVFLPESIVLPVEKNILSADDFLFEPKAYSDIDLAECLRLLGATLYHLYKGESEFTDEKYFVNCCYRPLETGKFWEMTCFLLTGLANDISYLEEWLKHHYHQEMINILGRKVNRDGIDDVTEIKFAKEEKVATVVDMRFQAMERKSRIYRDGCGDMVEVDISPEGCKIFGDYLHEAAIIIPIERSTVVAGRAVNNGHFYYFLTDGQTVTCWNNECNASDLLVAGFRLISPAPPAETIEIPVGYEPIFWKDVAILGRVVAICDLSVKNTKDTELYISKGDTFSLDDYDKDANTCRIYTSKNTQVGEIFNYIELNNPELLNSFVAIQKSNKNLEKISWDELKAGDYLKAITRLTKRQEVGANVVCFEDGECYPVIERSREPGQNFALVACEDGKNHHVFDSAETYWHQNLIPVRLKKGSHQQNHEFLVNDVVIGNSKANKYAQSKEGTIGVVVEILADKNMMRVAKFDESTLFTYLVDIDCFDYVGSVPANYEMIDPKKAKLGNFAFATENLYFTTDEIAFSKNQIYPIILIDENTKKISLADNQNSPHDIGFYDPKSSWSGSFVYLKK
jgi:hypothetical protein